MIPAGIPARISHGLYLSFPGCIVNDPSHDQIGKGIQNLTYNQHRRYRSGSHTYLICVEICKLAYHS